MNMNKAALFCTFVVFFLAKRALLTIRKWPCVDNIEELPN